MKSSIGVAVTVFLIVLGIWLADLLNDQSNSVKVTESVAAYSDWECGYQHTLDCKVVFETEVNKSYPVQRIRYGKDFMAVKVSQVGISGWIYAGKGVQVNAEPNT
ncbi:hypothetical protein CF168_04800 [Shewanella bicestrii]|uniref:Uncharacterized protein n=1 Tax=Shewanella bicestrii TaxID=2018305 RepID=A0A220UK28_9GAMM|nr:hypothetical protein [Shewanella bicestrii]ASK68246.1 hypothetical protein CF168_04800 [Shewanella bicestrii]